LTHKPGTERFAKSAHAPKGVVTAAVADVLLPGLSDELAAASTDTSDPASSAHIYAPPRWLREEVRALFGLLPIAWTKSNIFSFMNTKYCEFYASESSRQPLKLSTHPPIAARRSRLRKTTWLLGSSRRPPRTPRMFGLILWRSGRTPISSFLPFSILEISQAVFLSGETVYLTWPFGVLQTKRPL
jgi:hypothetical protein